MTNAEKRDLQDILDVFPFAHLDEDDRSPIIAGSVPDGDNWFLDFTIRVDGNCHLDVSRADSIAVSPEALDALSAKVRSARILLAIWKTTASGKKWEQRQS